MTVSFTTPSSIPFTKIALSKTSIEKACAVVPEFENRISRFDKKLRMTQCVEHIIYDHKLKMAQYL